MAQIAWITPAGELGTYAELLEFSIQLEANNPLTSDLTYQIISGSLPPGIQLYPSGLLYGIPNIVDPGSEISRKFKFTVRATNAVNQIADRTFAIAINGITPPTINTTTESLGTFFDSDYINLQIAYTETNPGTSLTWTVTNGELPLGLTLTQQGQIKGFALAPPAGGPAGTAAYDIGAYDQFVWDFEGATLSRTYRFSVRVFDGILSAERSYSIKIFAKSFFRTDNTLILSDTNAFTTDRDGYQYPTIITDPSEILPVRQDRAYAFQLKSYYFKDTQPVYWKIVGSGPAVFDMGAPPVPDEQGNSYSLSPFDDKGFDQANLSLPPGLILDKETGWLTGTLGAVTANRSTYTFTAVAYVEIPVSATAVSVRESAPVTYTIDILQDIDHYVVWNTPADLGIIDNGRVSTLEISGQTNRGETLTFSIKSGRYSRLPQGLSLLPTGLLSGRTTFDFFSMDRSAYRVTLDDGTSTFDSKYTFSVLAQDSTGIVYDIKEFTITVRNVNTKPFENLYMRAFLPSALRERFKTTIQDPNLVSIPGEDIVYRRDDPYFGLASDIKFLAVPGTTAATPASYVAAMSTHHRNKKINFTELKLAYAVDENLQPLYEVIYVQVKDYNDTSVDNTSRNLSRSYTSRLSDAGLLISQSNTLPVDQLGTLTEGLYASEDAGSITAVPSSANKSTSLSNTFGNMTGEIIDNIGYEYQGALPKWMTTIQPGTGQPLGFIRAVVLAYLKPGAGERLLFRYQSSLTASGFGVTALMNQYSFVADRYQWDRALSINYDPVTEKFNPATATTFDKIPSTGIVDYGPWNVKSSNTYSNLNAVDYGNGEYIAVGENATIITSRSGETWSKVPQNVDLEYRVSLLVPTVAGADEFQFGYGVNFSLGDELLNKGIFTSSSKSFITDIKQLIRVQAPMTGPYGNIVSPPFSGNIAVGTTLEFITFTGEVVEQVTQSAITSSTTSVQLSDNIDNIVAGYGVQIKGIDTEAAANVVINNTATNTIKLSANLTANVGAYSKIEFDDLNGNVVSLFTSAPALVGTGNLTFSTSTANVSLGSYARFANVNPRAFVQALNTNVVVTNGTVDALSVGSELYFTSVISSDASAGDNIINMSSTEKIGIGSAVVGDTVVVSSTRQTATWPAVTGTSLSVTIPTADILGTTPVVGMNVLAYQFPADAVVTAVTTSGTNTIVDVEFASTTVTGNPKVTKTANVASSIKTTDTLIGLTSISDINLNDYVVSANISIASKIKVTNIFANTRVLIGTTSESQLISAGDTVTFQTPAAVDFSAPAIVPAGTVVLSKTPTSITLSSPLTADLKTGYDSLIKFGLGELQLNYIVYTGASWLAVGSKGIVLQLSDNVWTLTYALPYGDLTGIAYDPLAPAWVVVGTEGLIARSSDFSTWTRILTGASATLRSIDSGISTFVAVGDAGTIIVSLDGGVNWTINNSITTRNLNSVKYINNNWIIVGEKGVVLTSTNGVNWNVYNSGVTYTLRDVTYINTQYLAVGDKGIVLESSDATRWAIRPSNQATDLTSIANNTRDPVVVGKNGLVLVEADSYTVDWAIRGVSFEMFNYNSLAQMAALGYRVKVGDTLIFAQQEGFDPSQHRGSVFENDGWNQYVELFDSETTALNYDSDGFDALNVVPGYFESLLDANVTNQRAGIWQIALNPQGIAYLEFVRQVQLGQVLTIKTESLKLVYDSAIKQGSTVPGYQLVNQTVNNSSDSTTFDMNSTRINDPRDTYLSDPSVHDKYLKFPNTGVLQ